jgi:threonine/homoserine/homoserine lactone efflux protein
MFTPDTIVLFGFAALALLLIPGPAVTYIVTRSITQGRAAGLVSVAGVHVGTTVHILAATVGLSGLLLSSALAFDAVKYAGAAYLVFIGIRTFTAQPDAVAVPARLGPGLRRVFADAVLVNVLNPKTALFFLAFLPQFVDPARGPVWAQTLVLGGTFVAIGLVTDSAYAFTASAAAERLRTSGLFAHVRTRAAGLIYIALGASALLTSRGDDRPVGFAAE